MARVWKNKQSLTLYKAKTVKVNLKKFLGMIFNCVEFITKFF